ncbi:unnamed protein product [Ectocarpus sp. CCAP 1310/34]|nr:unnamed protein product [Ectocarpus sp. CCAP 1310/34]
MSPAGATFFGVQFAYECFCGSSTADYDKHGSLPDSDCEYLCDANPDQFCGGFSAMEVFTIEAPAETEAPATSPLVAQPIEPIAPSPTTTPSDASYLGCYVDSETARVFPVTTASSAMTLAFCADFCAEYAYYGTQYGEEVYSTGSDPVETPTPVAVIEPTDPTYLGCYVDSQTDRIFPVTTASDVMTLAVSRRVLWLAQTTVENVATRVPCFDVEA